MGGVQRHNRELLPRVARLLAEDGGRLVLLAPARGPRLRVEGQVVKAGRTISVVEGHAWQPGGEGAGETLVATLTATVMTVLGRGIAG